MMKFVLSFQVFALKEGYTNLKNSHKKLFYLYNLIVKIILIKKYYLVKELPVFKTVFVVLEH